MNLYIYLTLLSIFVFFSIYNFRKKISLFFKVNDIPDQDRKIHQYPTPKTASYPIFITLLIILVMDKFLNIYEDNFKLVIFGTLLIFIIGYLDDRFNLSAIKKIFFSTLIIIFLLNASQNFIITKFYIYSFDTFFNLNYFSFIFTILCILCLINSLNLADGINGLATGLIFIWLIYLSEIYKYYISKEIFFLILIILINLILIFLYNLKGNHFLGDSGSLMLSSFVAILTIYLHNQALNDPGHKSSAENILLLFIIPVFDMVRLLFSRLIKSINPAKGDNNHLHHHLINNFSINKSLLIYFLLVNIPIILALFTMINKMFIIGLTLIFYSLTIVYLKKNEK